MLHLPKTLQDWSLFMLFWIGGLWTLVYEYFFVMSYYNYKPNYMVKIHLLIAAFLAFNIYINMYCLITTDVSAETVKHPVNAELLDWKFCEKCQRKAPPRSHHCKICDTCILKRDHHCWFAGYCIGFGNHRYFFCLVFYTAVAGIYANIYNWDFFVNVKGGFSWTTLPALVGPHVGLAFGYYTFYEFFITVITSTGFLFTILFIWLVYNQIVQIINGQVMHERRKGISDYNLGLSNSLNEVFGSAGFLVLLCPLVPSTLPGDGTSFPKLSDKSV